MQEQVRGEACSKTQQEEINGLFVALSRAGGEGEEENIDNVQFVKETKFGENWLVKQAIELQEKVQ